MLIKNEKLFWGTLLSTSIGFIAVFTTFLLMVVYPFHVDDMKNRGRETLAQLQFALPHLAPAARQSYLEQVSRATRNLSYLLIMDRQGKALAHSSPLRVGMVFDEPGIRRAIASNRRIEQLYLRDRDNPSSPYHDEKTIDILEPYYSAAGDIAGVVNVGISLKAVEEIKHTYIGISAVGAFCWVLFISGFARVHLGTMALKQKSDQALRESEELYREIFNATSEAIFIHSLESGKILDVNETTLQMYGFDSKDEVLECSIGMLSAGDRGFSGENANHFIALTRDGQPQIFEWLAKKRNGELFWVEVSLRRSMLRGEDHVLAVVRNISERKRLEELLNQSQKMESIGRLAGGVAHDFNNMLTVIIGSTALALDRIPEDDPVRCYLAQVVKAAHRSSAITRQLLAFSRQEVISPRPVNLNTLLRESEMMLSRLIGEDVTIAFKPATGLWTVKIDPSQVDQILMNLSVNARDAMPNGGHLTIETTNVHINGDYSQHHLDVRPGDHVLLTVSDTGIGMVRETREHIFEPFFTTKGLGEGTGLGLATVYGIVTQNNGCISVSSEPGQGATFKIFLPRFIGDTLEEEDPPAAPLAGKGTILLVEDEELLLWTITMLLEEIGYDVISAESPQKAIAICRRKAQRIDLILTDVVMPGMNGREMIKVIKVIRPDIRVLFMSGYSADIVAKRGILEEGMHYVPKPLDMTQLSEKIGYILSETYAKI